MQFIQGVYREASTFFRVHTSRAGVPGACGNQQHAKEGFPPCMRNMFMKLRTNHHLKHTGRMQLGLFLKVCPSLHASFGRHALLTSSRMSTLSCIRGRGQGCGLSLEDSMALWRQELVQVVGDKFDKEYAYNIRHNYGAEGKRVSYSPYRSGRGCRLRENGDGEGKKR